MSSSAEFKKALREGKLNKAFIIAMTNAPELHITTWISSPENTTPSARKSLRTHVNLVEGKIANEIGEELIGDHLYSAISQFHVQQVTQGHQAISQNLRSLQQMFRLMTILQKQKNGEDVPEIQLLEAFPKTLSAPTPIAIEPTTISPPHLKPSSNPSIQQDFSSLQNTKIETDSPDEIDEIDDSLISLEDLGIEDNPRRRKAEEEDEEWGEWLHEEDNSMESEILSIDSLDLDESEAWGEEGDETEFIPNTSAKFPKDER